MKAVITVIGKDVVGIMAKVSTLCAQHDVNIFEVTQSVLHDVFAMVMLCEIQKCNIPFADFSVKMAKMGTESGLSIHVMHEDIFNSMHKI